MKPISLTLSNFGPFVEEQTLRFENLDEIFLISGPTGSGKTTIFDGMLFALYGSPAGTRGEEDIKSNYMGETGETVVIFDFSVKGSAYKIERKLITRKNRKGDIVDEKSHAVYKKNGDKYIPVEETGTLKKLNEYITGLLHLSKDEFSKIILLPQGEFQKFLEEESSGREKILQKLFPTHQHYLVSEFFKHERNKIINDIKIKESQLKEIEKGFKPESFRDDIDVFEKEIKVQEDLRKEKNSLNDRLVARKEREEGIAGDFKELELKKIRLGELKSEKEKIEGLKLKKKSGEEAARLKPGLDRFMELSNAVEETGRKISQLMKVEGGLLDKQKKIDERVKGKSNLEKKQSILEQEIGKLAPLVEKEREREIKLKLLKEKTGKYKKSREEKESCEKDLKKIRAAVEESRGKAAVLEEEIQGQADLFEKRNIVHRRITLIKDYQDELLNKQDLSIKINNAETALKINKVMLDDLKKKKDRSLASTLSSALKENEPCPVCGSKEHPAPANLKEEPFRENELLMTLEENYEKSLSEKNRLMGKNEDSDKQVLKLEDEMKNEGVDPSKDELILKKEHDEIGMLIEENRKKSADAEKFKKIIRDNTEREKRTSDMLEKLGELFVVSGNEKASLEAEVQNLSDDLKGMKNIAELIKKTEIELSGILSELDSITRDDKQINEDITRNRTEILDNSERLADEKKLLEEIKGKLENEMVKRGFTSAAEIKEAYLTEEEISELSKVINEYNDSLTSVNSGFHDMEKKLKDVAQPDIQRTISEIKKNYDELNIIEGKLKDLHTSRSLLEKNNEDHTKLKKELEKTVRESRVLYELADDLNGKNPRMVNFQNFILNYYLTRVTKYANNRLQLLSEGRYRLLVSDTAKNRKSQAGLELEVMDGHTGIPRSVKTLSGGEKFLASLSLALGLSDAIQERAGKIEMDSLFLDEGFGTLDDEALNRAISILDDIRENRMVGVISHVSELKKRIPCQVKVEKTNQGSRISMPTPV
jgi:DNA repair protein SbcC/Rad50